MSVSVVGPGVNNENHSTGTIAYEYLGGNSAGRTNSEANTQRKIYAGSTGRFKNLYAAFTLNQSSPSGPTNTLRINGADTALAIAIPQGATGDFENITDSVVAVDQDLVCIELDAPSGGVANRPWKSSVWFDADKKKHAITQAASTGGAVYQTNSNIEWCSIWGGATGEQSSESFVESVFWMNADARHGRVRVTSNSGTTDNTQPLRINGADSALVITIPGAATGFFENITDAVQIQYGDRVNWAFRTSASGASVTTNTNNLDITTFKGGAFHFGKGPRTTHNAGQTRYEQFWRNYILTHTGVDSPSHPMNERITTGFFSIRIHSNPGTGSEAQVTLLKELVATAMDLVIPIGATGQFTDFTTTVKYAKGDRMGVRIITPASGGQTGWGHLNMLGTEQPKFRIDAVNLGATNPDGSARGLGEPVCIQIGGSATVPAAMGVGGLAFAGLAPTVHEVAGEAIIIDIPAAGTLCLRGPIDIAVTDVPIPIPVGSLSFSGQTPTLGFGIDVPVGALVFTGQAPTADISVRRDMGVGALTFTGEQETLDFGLHPGPGALVFAGQAPAAFVQRTAAPGAGALVLAGQTPRLGFELHPGAGALSFTGQAPLANITVLRTPGAGALTLTGQQSNLDFGLHPAAGALLFTGQTPASEITVRRDPGVGPLVFQGRTPIVTVGILMQPGAGALVFTGQAPAAFRERTFAPGVGALTFTGQTPVRSIGINRAPGAGALVFAGQAPLALIGFTIEVPVGTLLLAGQTPVRSIGIFRNPPAGALVFQGQTPIRRAAESISVPAGALVFAGQTPGVATGIVRAPGAGALVFTGQAPTLGIAPRFDMPVGALVFTGQAPGLGFTCPAPAGALAFAGLVPTLVITIGAIVAEPGAGALVLQGQTATCLTGLALPIPAGAMAFAGLAPSLEFCITVPVGALALEGQAIPSVVPPQPGTGALLFTGHAPARLTTQSINVPVGELRLDGHAPSFAGVQQIAVLRGTLLLDGQTPIPGHGIPVGVGSLTLTGQAPSLQGLGVLGLGALVLQGQAPVLAIAGDGTASIEVPAGSLVLAGLVIGGVGGNVVVAMPVGTIVCASQAEPVHIGETTTTVSTFKVRRERAGTFIVDEQGWIYMSRLQLDFEAGVGLDGLASLDGHNPQIRLQWSDDGGQTWTAERSVSAGKFGAHRVRALWRRLGRSRKRVFRVRMDDPVKWALVDAYARVTKGTS